MRQVEGIYLKSNAQLKEIMRDNYNDNKIKETIEIEELSEKTSVYRRTSSFKTRRERGARKRTMWISEIIQKSWIRKNTEHMTMDYYEMVDMMPHIVGIKLPKFLYKYTDEFMCINLKKESINQAIMKFFDCGARTAKDAMATMRRVGFIKKHDKHTWSINPYVIGWERLAGHKLYQLQCHWEISKEPMTEWIEIDEEEEWEKVKEGIDRTAEVIEANISMIKIEKSDYKALEEADFDSTINALKDFWGFYEEKIAEDNNNEEEGKEKKVYETLTEYLKSEEGIRHLRNWWISPDSSEYRAEAGGIDLVFPYRQRAKYRQYFIALIAEYYRREADKLNDVSGSEDNEKKDKSGE